MVVYFSVVITVNLLLYSSLLVYQEPYTFLSKELKLQQNYDALNSQGEANVNSNQNIMLGSRVVIDRTDSIVGMFSKMLLKGTCFSWETSVMD